MQELWYEVHYSENNVQKDSKLPKDRTKTCRIRQNNPPPKSIFSGEKVKYRFKVKLYAINFMHKLLLSSNFYKFVFRNS